jgi:hypothetical protein
MKPAIVIALLALSPAVRAENARLTHVHGDVRVERPKKDPVDKAKAGTEFTAGDTVVTGPDSLAIATLPGGALTKLNAGTRLTAIRLAANDNEVKLESGGVFSQVRAAKSARSVFRVRARSATMGVRGTEFFAAYGQESDVWMCVNEGSVEVISEDGKPVTVPQGQGVFIKQGSEVTPPKPYAWTKNLNWNMDPKKGEVRDQTSMESAYGDLKTQNYD